jgi:high-affinity Fe2+/Pb2+ permease
LNGVAGTTSTAVLGVQSSWRNCNLLSPATATTLLAVVVVVLLFAVVFTEAFNALGGIQLFARNDEMEGVVTRAVCAGFVNGAVLSDDDNSIGFAAHIEGIRLQRASKTISTIIYLMKACLSLRCL